MQDAINFVMLACPSLAALAFGVLFAYGVCRAGFAAIRAHTRSVAAQTAQPEPALRRASGEGRYRGPAKKQERGEGGVDFFAALGIKVEAGTTSVGRSER